MTAVLASIGLWGWGCIVLGSSLIFALLIGGMIRRADETERAQYPPPVPAPRPRESDLDATWLDAWPTEARWVINADAMEQERYDRLFDDLIAIEGLQ